MTHRELRSLAAQALDTAWEHVKALSEALAWIAVCLTAAATTLGLLAGSLWLLARVLAVWA